MQPGVRKSMFSEVCKARISGQDPPRRTIVQQEVSEGALAPQFNADSRSGGTVSNEEKAQSKAEKAKGKLKETTGKATGNESLEEEGRAEQTKGTLREGKEDLKDTARGAAEGLRNKNSKEQDEQD